MCNSCCIASQKQPLSTAQAAAAAAAAAAAGALQWMHHLIHFIFHSFGSLLRFNP
jgi:hypothetical protein